MRRREPPDMKIHVELGATTSSVRAMVCQDVWSIFQEFLTQHGLGAHFKIDAIDVHEARWGIVVAGVVKGTQFERLQELAYRARERVDHARAVLGMSQLCAGALEFWSRPGW